MSRRRIKQSCPNARVVTVKQWHAELAHLDELIRPVVLRVNEAYGLVTIRPKRADEIKEIKKRHGLSNEEMETRSGSLVTNPQKLVLEETT